MTDEELLKLAYQVCCQTSKVQPYNSEMSWTAYRVWRELLNRLGESNLPLELKPNCGTLSLTEQLENSTVSRVQTQTANTEDWLESTRGQEIIAYVQEDVPTISVSGRSLSSKIAEGLERSLTEHAAVWAELAKH